MFIGRWQLVFALPDNLPESLPVQVGRHNRIPRRDNLGKQLFITVFIIPVIANLIQDRDHFVDRSNTVSGEEPALLVIDHLKRHTGLATGQLQLPDDLRLIHMM